MILAVHTRAASGSCPPDIEDFAPIFVEPASISSDDSSIRRRLDDYAHPFLPVASGLLAWRRSSSPVANVRRRERFSTGPARGSTALRDSRSMVATEPGGLGQWAGGVRTRRRRTQPAARRNRHPLIRPRAVASGSALGDLLKALLLLTRFGAPRFRSGIPPRGWPERG